MLKYSDVEQLVREQNLSNYHTIVKATIQPKVKFAMPAGPLTTVVFDKVKQYYLHFSTSGIRMYAVDEPGTGTFLRWKDITSFRVRNGLISYRLLVQTEKGKLRLIISKFVLGQPWAKENAVYLAENNFFYPSASL